jgi:hypothetical protein
LLVRGLAETVSVPKELLKDLYAGLVKVEEVLATLEELMDREGLERTRKAEREYVKGEYVTVKDSGEIKKFSARSKTFRNYDQVKSLISGLGYRFILVNTVVS